jgi:hypothetical protein
MVFGGTGVGSTIEVDTLYRHKNRLVDDDKMGLFYRRELPVTKRDQSASGSAARPSQRQSRSTS